MQVFLFLADSVLDLPICAEGLLPIFLGLAAASLMRSISCSYLFRSRSAFSLASFRADSRALTRSTVARSLFSILGISPRRLALSRSTYRKTHVVGGNQWSWLIESSIEKEPIWSPACEPWRAAPGCSPESWSSVCGRRFPRNSVSPGCSVAHSLLVFSPLFFI